MIEFKAIRTRLLTLDTALRACYVSEQARGTYMYDALLQLWSCHNLYVKVGYSASEWFNLEYPIYSSHTVMRKDVV